MTGQPVYRSVAPGHQALRSLHRRLHDPKSADKTARALEKLEQELFLQEFAAAYGELRNTDPAALAEEEAEFREWDVTLMDGLTDEDA